MKSERILLACDWVLFTPNSDHGVKVYNSLTDPCASLVISMEELSPPPLPKIKEKRMKPLTIYAFSTSDRFTGLIQI
jgi:hypothetical protein